MYSSVLSTAISGVEGVAVLVEADVSNGLPMFSMVGFLLPESVRPRTGYGQLLEIQDYLFPQNGSR